MTGTIEKKKLDLLTYHSESLVLDFSFQFCLVYDGKLGKYPGRVKLKSNKPNKSEQ